MLPHYTAMIFFPGGDPAAGASIEILSDGSNVPPLIYQDTGATLVQANPIIASPMGMIGFYASPGLYLAELSGTFVRVRPDAAWPDPVIPNVFLFEQNVPSNVWTVDHYFGTEPSVTVVSSGAQVETMITHPSLTQSVLTFSAPIVGTATLRR